MHGYKKLSTAENSHGTQVPLEQGKKNGMAFIYIAWLVNTFLSCTLDCQCNSYVT